MNRRGVSQIVSTILIILLVLVAIGIVWVVVERIVRSGGGIIEEKAGCIGVSLSLVDVECVSDGDHVNVTVSRGGDSANGNILILTSTNSTEQSSNASATLNPLGSVKVKIGTGAPGTSIVINTGLRLNDQAGTMCEGASDTYAC